MSTQFSEVVVDSINHGYRIGDKNLVSVTTILKSITPEFDRDGVSLKMAERSGVTQTEILKQWEDKGNKSRDKGTRLHQYIEDVMAGKVDPVLQRVNERIPEMVAFDDAWARLRAELDAKMVSQEFVVADTQFGVAGRVDNLMSILAPRSKSRLVGVFDWKSGKLDVENRYERLLPPFDGYDNCKFNLYSIQLSLYRLILERNPGQVEPDDAKFSNSYILHLRDDGTFQLHRARDFRALIGEWLKDGVPASAQGDPATEKRAQELTKTLDTTVDREFATRLSERTRRDLSRAAKTASMIIASLSDDNYD